MLKYECSNLKIAFPKNNLKNLIFILSLRYADVLML